MQAVYCDVAAALRHEQFDIALSELQQQREHTTEKKQSLTAVTQSNYFSPFAKVKEFHSLRYQIRASRIYIVSKVRADDHALRMRFATQ